MNDPLAWPKDLIARHYSILKMGFLLVLVLVLLVPLGLIEDLMRERTVRRDQVVREISQAWGGPQWVSGPVLIVPYRYTVESEKWDRSDPLELRAEAYFLPEDLAVEAGIAPERRYRGIFDAMVYGAELRFAGRFAPPDFAALGIEQQDLFWDEARMALGITDLRGATGEPAVTWNGTAIPLRPGTGSELLGGGVHAPIRLDLAGDPGGDAPMTFDLALRFTGSQSLSFIPAAKTTRVALDSPWPHPSFEGAYLPAERTVGDDGFTAAWALSYLGRDYPQSWSDRNLELADWSRRIDASRFGVALVSPVDFYLKSERSVKHGVLFILLIFAATFVFEVIAALKIHVVQYALVGAALALFYLLLLSLAEVFGFLVAYVIAAALSSALITLYIAKVLASRRRAGLIAAILAAVYGYLYIVLQLETLALVTGALGLFAALAAVMYVTRNVDWYALKRA